MVTTIIVLSIALLVLAIVIGILAVSVPWLWWQYFKQERRIRILDRNLSELLETIFPNTGTDGTGSRTDSNVSQHSSVPVAQEQWPPPLKLHKKADRSKNPQDAGE